MCTGVDQDGHAYMTRQTTKPGDHVDLLALMDVLAVPNVCGADVMRTSNFSLKPLKLDRAGLDQRGFSSLYIAVDGKLAGLVPYSDKIRDESPQVIRSLHERGIRNTIMLTGGNAVVARAVCGDLGLTRHFADMLPADKANVIQELQREGRRVAMVGDGINDSPALSFTDGWAQSGYEMVPLLALAVIFGAVYTKDEERNATVQATDNGCADHWTAWSDQVPAFEEQFAEEPRSGTTKSL